MTDQIEKHTVIDSDEISLKDLILKIQDWWRFLLSNWKVILCAGVVSGLIGLAYAWINKPIYKAELSFALQDEKSSGGGLSSALGLASQLGIDVGGTTGGEFAGDNLIELMKSRSMFEKSLLTPISIDGHEITLAEFYIDFNELRKTWSDKSRLESLHFLPAADPDKFTLQQDSLLGVFYHTLLKKNIVVDKADKKLSIINVNVQTTNELFSKYFAEVLTKVVSDFYIQTKTEKQAKNVAILQRQTDSVRRILYGNMSGAAESIDVNPNPNPFLQVLKVPSQRKQVEVQGNIAILTQLVTNLEVAKMSLLQETPLIQIIDRPILPLEKNKIGKLMAIFAGFSIGAFLAVIVVSLRKFFRDLIS